jgi:outer membrane biosynthesis protein TonB
MLSPIAAPQASTAKTGEASDSIVLNDIPPSVIGDLAKPVYPAAALAAHAGACIVYVTIAIDTKGAVSEVTPSWQRLNIPNRFSQEFFEAVKEAVRMWKFEPARRVYWQKAGNEDLKYIKTEIIPVQTDIRFTFETSGTVR